MKKIVLTIILLGIIFQLIVPLNAMPGSGSQVLDTTGKTKFHRILVGGTDITPVEQEHPLIGGPGSMRRWAQTQINTAVEIIEKALNKWKEKENKDNTLEKFIYDPEQDPANNTKEDIQKYLDNLKKHVEKGEEISFYFFGHGNDKEIGYFGKPEDKGKITQKELSKMLSGFKPSVTIVIVIVACFSERFVKGVSDEITNSDNKKLDAEHLRGIGSSKKEDELDIRSGFVKSLSKSLEEDDKNPGYPRADTKGPETREGYKDGVTTPDEVFNYSKTDWMEFLALDNDNDTKLDEDDVEYDYENLVYLFVDNDGDSLIDEDPAPKEPYLYIPSYVPPPVGGYSIPIDKPKLDLWTPYIGLASTTLIATVATVIYVKRIKHRKER
jgi:hypothetical protein